MRVVIVVLLLCFSLNAALIDPLTCNNANTSSIYHCCCCSSSCSVDCSGYVCRGELLSSWDGNTPKVNCNMQDATLMECWLPFVGDKDAVSAHLACPIPTWMLFRSEDQSKPFCAAMNPGTCVGISPWERTSSHERCIYRNGYFFPSVFVYASLLFFTGFDLFYLGYTFLGILKTATLGGFGIWSFINVILLTFGWLEPHDGAAWEPGY